MSNSLEDVLVVAIRAAQQAGEVALAQNLAPPATEIKDDGSPVTEADRATEEVLRKVLLQQYPHDGMLGEEGIAIEGSSGLRWIVDPIDGTRDYIRRTSRWAVLVALEEINTASLLLGVVHFPALGETYTAIRGQGAYHNGQRMSVSSVTRWQDAVVHVNNLMLMQKASYGEHLLPWLQGCNGVRNLGGAMDAIMVASGKADVWLDPVTKPWDLAPLKLIIEEAGGSFHANDGVAGIRGGSAVAYTPLLAPWVATLLQSSRP